MEKYIEVNEYDATKMVYGDHPDFKVISDTIVENSRWSILHDVVLQRKADGAFFLGYYDAPATEMQDGQDMFATLPVKMFRAEPHEKVTIEYKAVPQD